MLYLTDAAIFALVPLVSVLLGWWCAHPKRTTLENTLIPGSACLGAYALWLWLRGQVIGVGFDGWLLLFLLFIPPRLALTQRKQAFISNARSAWHGVRGLRGLDLALVLYLCLVFVITFILTLAPPSGGDYDSLVYHLAAPRQYLRAHAIHELPYDHHTYFPFTMEMLYMLGLGLRGPVLAKLFHWWMLPLSCGAVVAMGQRHLSLRAGLWGAALFASLPVVQAEASTAYIDLGLTAYSCLAFLCFVNWLESDDRWWLAWSGVFCGFCLGIKYLGALIFGWLLLWAIGRQVMARKFDLKATSTFLIWALVLGGGWYVRNWVWTGNPVFPFAYGLFHGRGWSPEMAAAYTADQIKFGFGRSPLDWLWLPWRVAMTPLNAGAIAGKIVGLPFWPLSDVVVDNGTSGLFEVPGLVLQTVIGPFLLALGAPLLLVKRKPQIIEFILWSFAAFAVFWAATGQYIRYLIPQFALLSLACGWGVTIYLNRSAILKWAVSVSLAAWLSFGLVYNLWSFRNALAVISGQETPEAYLMHFPAYEAMHWASTNTPPNARFAIYGEPRCFYLERDYFWADDQHNNLIDYSQVQSGTDLVRELKRLGATHVLWNMTPESNGGAFGPPAQPMQDAIQQGLLKMLFKSKGYGIYQTTGQGEAMR
ncbi:MAG: glycosyltransferase family 39 protein [Abitibacteriaceae bacterium]|nr:glycosyltransferase family 39 protein [Abditibacteriaceae bacterium]